MLSTTIFTFHLKDAKNLDISMKFGIMIHNVYLKCTAVCNVKNPRWRTAAILKITKIVASDDAEWVP